MRTALSQKWIVLSAVAVISFVIGGSGAVAVGLIIDPLMIDFRWSNGLASSIATAYSLAALSAAPGVGLVLDKLGARPTMVFGLLVTSIGFLLASLSHSHYQILAAFALSGIGYSASYYVPSAVVVSNWMDRRRGLGMGIVMGSMSAGAAFFSLLIGWWIETHGWRATIEVLAILVALTLPVPLFILRSRPLPDLRTSDCRPEPVKSASGRDWDLLLSRPFVVATMTGALFSIGMNSIYYHVVSVLLKAGFSAHVAGLVFGVTWLLSALGSLGFGVIADRLGARIILTAALFSCGLGTVFLLGANQSHSGISCVVVFVMLWGTSANSVFQFLPVIFAERFGSRNLGTLVGVQSAVGAIAGAAAPIVTGMLYDEAGDYSHALYLSAAATFTASFLALLITSSDPLDGNSRRRQVNSDHRLLSSRR